MKENHIFDDFNYDKNKYFKPNVVLAGQEFSYIVVGGKTICFGRDKNSVLA